MKMINKLLMIALVSSVFLGCSKDDEDKNLPLAGVSGTYEGAITVAIPSPVTGEAIAPIPTNILIAYSSGNNAVLSLNLSIPDILPVALPISVTCAVTSTEDNYSLSGNASIEFPELGTIGVVIANTSKVDKSGKATIDITATVAEAPLPVKFEGQKK
ncbi:MAG: hypothetical protein LBK96_05110 [Prevotellaceae bacterium]|jgi:hypothetical protein|nr:hypothetical protein [Prevotellaceae bacterium]